MEGLEGDGQLGPWFVGGAGHRNPHHRCLESKAGQSWEPSAVEFGDVWGVLTTISSQLHSHP